MHFFDPDAPVAVTQRNKLPHWTQPGVITFVTWRTCDSLPKTVLASWRSDRNRWLRSFGIDPFLDPNWRTRLNSLPPHDRLHFHKTFTSRWHDALDSGHGACPLRDQALSEIVANSLVHFDGDRYAMEDFIIMPNHVHLLATFPSLDDMLDQCASWKRYTARRINSETNRTGSLWQTGSFDHLVRSERQYVHLKRYIADNPVKARLQPQEYRLMSK